MTATAGQPQPPGLAWPAIRSRSKHASEVAEAGLGHLRVKLSPVCKSLLLLFFRKDDASLTASLHSITPAAAQDEASQMAPTARRKLGCHAGRRTPNTSASRLQSRRESAGR